MKYTLYKTTNNINGNIYIGVHKTKDINDAYMGSGKILKLAIAKYGVDNFTKEVLEVFNNSVDMYSMELIVVNEDFIKRKDTYNIQVGGEGGWNNNDGSDEHIERCRKTGKLSYPKSLLLWSKSDDTEIKRKRSIIAGNTFRGRKHTNESKNQMSGSQKKHDRTGNKNPMYGKCWIYNNALKISKRIDKEELLSGLEDGWMKGRKMKFWTI